MQSRGARAALIVGALIVAAVAFVVLRPPGGDEDQAASRPTTEAESIGAGGDDDEDDGRRDRTDGPPRPVLEPAATEIEVQDGAPVGGVADVEVDKGDDVSLLVRADAADHVHVHGYDEFADVAPGKPAKLKFPADIEGIFEIELEDSHVQIARLEVAP